MKSAQIIILLSLLIILVLILLLEGLFKRNLFNSSIHMLQKPEEPHNDYTRKGVHMRHFHDFGDITVLFCHGNNGNISHRDYVVKICSHFGVNLLLFDYHGYGLSSGNHTTTTIRRSGKIAYKFMIDELKLRPDKIVIWGESLGGNVASYLASKYKVRTLIMFCTFSSIYDAVMQQTSPLWLRAGVSVMRLWMDMLPSKKYMNDVECPVIIIHSREDNIIPFSNSMELYDSVKHENKVLIPISGDHADPHISPVVLVEIFSRILDNRSIDEVSLYNLGEELQKVRQKLIRDPEFYLDYYKDKFKKEISSEVQSVT